ncbi:MAG TPA: hypothetical protein VHA10_05400 [Hypericibacter adhaerens]|uniref:hypothetical protein n=1 Tax=Hypericibacter adhaerens TaxID=2602016 RepID=UPI002D17D0B3|nr:hypothetical protein [Hypericibacter adhaerens]HWA42625.1 hypothetical protein [Hypericibacter adhaerens]
MTGLRRSAASFGMVAVLLAASGCGPHTRLPDSIDVKLRQSEEQGLVLSNTLPDPVTIAAAGTPETLVLAPGATARLRFRVLSLASYSKTPDEPYYVPTPTAPTNHFEPLDHAVLFDQSTPAPSLHYQAASGAGTVAFDLNNCAAADSNGGWESRPWPGRDHPAPIGGGIPGVPVAVCPVP